MKKAPIYIYVITVITYSLILLPLVVVAMVSVDASENYLFPPSSFSLKWYEKFLSTPSYYDSLFRVSLPVASAVALTATILGGLAAIALVRFQWVGRRLAEGLFLAPLMVPDILLGVSLYLLLTEMDIRSSIFSLIAGHCVIAIPYVVRSVTAGLAGINHELEEAAINLGANKVRAFVLVVLPLLRSSVLSGAVFAFIVSLGDVNLALFLSGPQSTTLPVHIFSDIQWGSDPTVAAASTIQIFVVGMLILIVQRIFRLRLT